MVQANLFGVCFFYGSFLEFCGAYWPYNTWLSLGGIDLYVGAFV